MNTCTPEIECPDCEGWGDVRIAIDDIMKCPACNGEGWHRMTDGELDAAAEKQAEDDLSEPPETMAEQHRRAWEQKQELRR